jgi:hypothetical protein
MISACAHMCMCKWLAACALTTLRLFPCTQSATSIRLRTSHSRERAVAQQGNSFGPLCQTSMSRSDATLVFHGSSSAGWPPELSGYLGPTDCGIGSLLSVGIGTYATRNCIAAPSKQCQPQCQQCG